MAYQEINRGTIDNDSTGDNLKAAGLKINQNFSELYNYFGNGTTLNYAPNLQDINDVSGSPLSGNILYYDGTNWVMNSGPVLQYNFSANGNTAYRIAGPGSDSNSDNPALFVYKGFTYIFNNTAGGSHPLLIQYSDTTSLGSFLSGNQTGIQILTVPMVPHSANLQYNCTIHTVSMVGSITII